MKTYRVNIVSLTNAEGDFFAVGKGTLVIDDVRDEVAVTGIRVGRWVISVLIVAFLLFLCSNIPPGAPSAHRDGSLWETGLLPSDLIRIGLLLTVILLAIFRKRVFFFTRKVAVRFSAQELGPTNRGVGGSVEILGMAHQAEITGGVEHVSILREKDDREYYRDYAKRAEVQLPNEAEAEAVIDAVNKLRDW